jgi:hypothetical protein
MYIERRGGALASSLHRMTARDLFYLCFLLHKHCLATTLPATCTSCGTVEADQHTLATAADRLAFSHGSGARSQSHVAPPPVLTPRATLNILVQIINSVA